MRIKTMATSPQLKPGNMESTTFLTDNKPDDFASSMAEAIENALWTMLHTDGMNTFDKNTNSRDARDRRRIFIAIAQGVIRHLKDNVGALQVSFTDSAGNLITVPVTIAVDATLLPDVAEGS
jgi:hypothetical protein